MKIKITIGAAMVLTLGSALAGGLIIQNKGGEAMESIPAVTSATTSEVTPEMIAKWKVTASTSDYSPPMLPI